MKEENLVEWGHPENVDEFQKYLWSLMYQEWRRFSGKYPQPSLDVGAATRKSDITVSLDPFPRGPVDFIALGECLPFSGSSFRSVILESVLKHTLSPQDVLSEARRVTKDGGLLFLTSPVNRVDNHRHSFTEKQLCALVRNSGFCIVRKRGLGIKYKLLDGFLWRRIPRLFARIPIPCRFSTVLFIVARAA